MVRGDRLGLVETWNWFYGFYVNVGDYVPVFIYGHEVGHGETWRVGWYQRARFSVSREHMADCLAGAVTRWLYDNNRIAGGAYAQVGAAMRHNPPYGLGDSEGSDIYADGAHGTGAVRQAAVTRQHERLAELRQLHHVSARAWCTIRSRAQWARLRRLRPPLTGPRPWCDSTRIDLWGRGTPARRRPRRDPEHR